MVCPSLIEAKMLAEKKESKRESMEKKEKIKNQEEESKRIRRDIFKIGLSIGVVCVGLFHALFIFPFYIVAVSGVVPNILIAVFTSVVYGSSLCFFVYFIRNAYLANQRLHAAAWLSNHNWQWTNSTCLILRSFCFNICQQVYQQQH